jgi:hypothetical protein
MPLYVCEPQFPLTAEYGPLCAYLFGGKEGRRRKTSTGWATRVTPNTIVSWKVTCIVPYAERLPNRGLDCTVKMEGMPLAYIKERALAEAMKQAGYES